MKISLQNFDLNLLVIFDALMIERNVSKAAEKVFLSQSAMSHALNRLRALLDDPILVRTEKGMMPTPRALTMEVPIREALTNIQHNLYSPEPFDPSTKQETFVIYVPEYFEGVYLPILTSHLQKVAPNVKVMAGILKQKFEERLVSGEIDYVLSIEGIHEIPGRLKCQPWIYDKLTCVVSKSNKVVGDRITIDEFRNVRHIYHETLGTPYTQTILDKWLKNNKINHNIAISNPGYLGAAMITETTDYVLTLPLRLAQKLVQKMNLRVVEPPDNFPDYRLNLIWHPLYEKDPAQIWFRGQLLDLANQETG
ncbi:MAG: LysR family transcriptional regulator [Desulfobacterales bacterium]|nr:LysR family transcriptional regulator [Desulfobacterales bacterium]